jgi:hypothetical protein
MADEPETRPRPGTVDEYVAWLKKEHEVDASPGGRQETRYETVARKMQGDFCSSPFWLALLQRLPDFEAEYRVRAFNYPLLLGAGPPEVLVKPYDSFLKKTYRRNVLENANWPDAPRGGWLLPDSWYCRVSDIVRTSVVVKYLDGVKFLSGCLRELAEEHGVFTELSFEARMEGYYASHIVTCHECEVPRENWDTERIAAEAELQVTTNYKKS